MKLTHDKFSIDADDLGGSSVAYLLQYGFTQSMQDSVAGLAKRVVDTVRNMDSTDVKVFATANKAVMLWAAQTGWKGNPKATPNAFADSVIEYKLRERMNAITHGTIGTRSTSIESRIRELAESAIRAKAKKLNKVVRRKDLPEYVKLYIAANEESLRAEALKKMESDRDINAVALSASDLGLA